MIENELVIFLEWRGDQGLPAKGYEELSEVMEMFDLLIEVMGTRAHICQSSSNCRLEMSAFSGRYVSQLNFKRRAILGRSKIL